VFPLCVFVAQKLIAKIGNVFIFKYYTQKSSSRAGTRNPQLLQTREALEVVYLYGIYISSFTHTATTTLIATTRLFPDLYTTAAWKAFDPLNIFVPQGFLSSDQVESIAQGMHIFLQYDDYTGSAAMVIWAMYLSMTMRPKGEISTRALWKRAVVLVVLALYGPGTTTVILWKEIDHQEIISRMIEED
jgi:hypothetical protein